MAWKVRKPEITINPWHRDYGYYDLAMSKTTNINWGPLFANRVSLLMIIIRHFAYFTTLRHASLGPDTFFEVDVAVIIDIIEQSINKSCMAWQIKTADLDKFLPITLKFRAPERCLGLLTLLASNISTHLASLIVSKTGTIIHVAKVT